MARKMVAGKAKGKNRKFAGRHGAKGGHKRVGKRSA